MKNNRVVWDVIFTQEDSNTESSCCFNGCIVVAVTGFVFDQLAVFSTADTTLFVPEQLESTTHRSGIFLGPGSMFEELKSDPDSSSQNVGKVPEFL